MSRKTKRAAKQTLTAIELYSQRLFNIANTEFKYPNAPLSLHTVEMEKKLFDLGAVAIFEDPVIGLMSLPFIPQKGKIDPWGIPTSIEVYGVNGYRKKLDKGEFVVMYNDSLRIPSRKTIWYYAGLLADLDETARVNCRAQKTPVMLRCTEEERLTIENLYAQYDGNAPVIHVYKNFDPESIKVVKTDAPFVSETIYKIKEKYWNEALTYLGVSNLTIQKSQHVIQQEMSSSLGGVYACRNSRLLPRLEAFRKVNELFGVDIVPEYNSDVEALTMMQLEVAAGGGSDRETEVEESE